MGSSKLPRGKLSVTLFEAHGTKGDEGAGVGKADPYGIIKLANIERKTKVARDAGSKPIWNQTFTFDLTTSDPKYNELTITILNDNSWRKDTPIGESRIDLASLVAEKGNSIPATWFPVILDGDQYGWIYVSLDFAPIPDRSVPLKGNSAPDDKSGVTNSGTPTPKIPEEPNRGQRKPVPGKNDTSEDPATGNSSAANTGTPNSKASGKLNGSEGEAVSNSQKENSAPDPTSGKPSVTNNSISVPKVPEELNGTTDEAVSNSWEEDDGPLDEEGGSTEGDQQENTELGKKIKDNTNDGVEDNLGEGIDGDGIHHEEKSGGLRNAATRILEASKGLGRKFSNNLPWTAVPPLVIACLVLATMKRKQRNIHGEYSDTNVAGLKEETRLTGHGIPTSSRQKLLFYKIYGTQYNP